jgi:hypothetical protein
VIQCERRLVFENGLLPSVPSAQHMAFDDMRNRIAGRRRQGSIDQFFRASDAGRGRSRIGHSSGHAVHQYRRQSALCLDGLRIECQCVLEQISGLPVGFPRPGLQ